MKKINPAFLLLLILLVSEGCQKRYTPKPRGYFRITFPEKAYQTFQQPYPYCFDYPVYATILPDLSPNAEPYWMDLSIEENKARIHLSYKPVRGNLDVLTEESRNLVYKHTIKASSINEKIFTNLSEKVYGTLFEIKGNTASPYQFHLTDSSRHFIRGSLYISETPNYDSLFPVITFLEKDLLHLVETFLWNNYAAVDEPI